VPSLRLAYFGTPEFAVPSLERLVAGPHEVVLVVSQPDRRRGRGRKHSPSPVSALAEREGIALLRPERVAAPEVVASISRYAPDLGVVVAFGQFLPKRVRECPRLGFLINGHASLLPRHRGAAPIARAILEGEPRTGVSVMRIEREMDAGPVAATRSLEIGADEDTGSLTQRLAALTADAIADVVDRIADVGVTWTPQDHDRATFAPKIERDDAHLDFREGARALVDRVRAMAPSPGAFTFLDGEMVRILAAIAAPGAADSAPGCVHRSDDGALRVATGEGWLLPTRVQRPGGRALDVAEFLRGREIPDGAVFGPDPATATIPG
jgi:methionyl-tRNA formyltransferase